jgi:sarcosine oxidase gamma subunit
MRIRLVALWLLMACPAAAQTSSLQGRVVRWGTAEPIAKATVELRRVTAGTAAPYVATTAVDGTFAFAAVSPGQYRIVSRRPGYVSAEYGQRWPNGAGTPLTIPAGRAISNLPIPMLQTGAINGRVRDRLGQPVGNAEVQALKATFQDGRRVLTSVQTVVSDDRGEFRLFWLTPGRYYVSARHPDISGGPMRFSGTFSSGGGIGPGGAPQFQEFRTNGDNASASAFLPEMRQVRAKERYVPVYYPGGTDEQSASSLELAPGADLTGIDFTLEPVPLQRVRGRVVYESNGEPAMSARVQWVSSTGASGFANDSPIGPRLDAVAVECCDGSFELGLPPGSYTLIAANNSINSRVPVQVGYADVDGVVISLGQSFNIPGRVTFEGRAPTPSELNALRISVAMNPPVPGLQPNGYSTVLPNGTLTLTASRGDFRVNISPLLNVPGAFQFPPRLQPGPSSNLYVKSIRLGGADVLNDGLHLEARPEGTLEIVVGTTPGTLEGVVLNDNREPVPNVAVSLVPDLAHRARTDLYKSISTDAAGRFRIDRIPPGDYVVFAWDGIESGEWQNPEFLAPFEGRGARVHLGDNAAVAIDLTAIPPTR